MRPAHPLPIDSGWDSPEQYVESLLTIVSTSELFRNLCGGVHVLDFLTRKPDLYSWVLPEEWRDWFDGVDINDILDLLLREDLTALEPSHKDGIAGVHDQSQWRNYSSPPQSLLSYVGMIRRHSLKRGYVPRREVDAIPRHIAVGMKTKKIHEVAQFAAFVDDLSKHVSSTHNQPSFRRDSVSCGHSNPDIQDHNTEQDSLPVIDFGSGQNYLGRTLACPPYKKCVIAIEQRHHNVEGARGMDVSARLIKKQKNIVNKKEWKQHRLANRQKSSPNATSAFDVIDVRKAVTEAELKDAEDGVTFVIKAPDNVLSYTGVGPSNGLQDTRGPTPSTTTSTASLSELSNSHKHSTSEKGKDLSEAGVIHYIEKELSSGNLSDISLISSNPAMVVSIHSCGNLTHHGLRSISLNPSVKAVALIGCCYNLLTERLGPPTYKLPTLRSNHPRLAATSSAFDPHGFPMSRKLENFTYPIKPAVTNGKSKKVYNLNGTLQDFDCTGRGVRLNITARMMAVQAPHNWGPTDSEEFFTRHYYRALLQKVLLDLGVVKMSVPAATPEIEISGGTLSGKDEMGSPLIIGSLRKPCFVSFEAYVRGAIQKLSRDPVDGPTIQDKTRSLFADDGELIRKYEEDYRYAKKHLSVIWSLMAFSADVVESTILVDRWLWLKEQKEVEDAWVESVFDYKLSPRNMVVVGIKRQEKVTDDE